jgi:hypothetical protein
LRHLVKQATKDFKRAIPIYSHEEKKIRNHAQRQWIETSLQLLAKLFSSYLPYYWQNPVLEAISLHGPTDRMNFHSNSANYKANGSE